MHLRESRSRDRPLPKPANFYFSTDSTLLEQSLTDFFRGTPTTMLMSNKAPSTMKALKKISQHSTDKIGYNPKSLTSYSLVKKKENEPETTQDSYNLQSISATKPDQSVEFENNTRLSLKLREREREVEALQTRVQELQREVNNKNLLNRSYVALNTDFQNSMNLGDIEKEDPGKQRQILSALILQTYDTFKNLKNRCNNVNLLLEVLDQRAGETITEYELSKMKKTIEELAETLVQATKTEIELGLKSRESEKKSQDYTKLTNQHNALRDQYRHLQDQCTDLKSRKQDLEERLQQMERQFDSEKAKNTKNEKQINLLEKRIELILETDITVDRDKLRKALTELVKENESLKRESVMKNKEIKKMKDDMNKVQTKVVRQNKKIDTLLRNKKGPSSTVLNDGDKEGALEDKVFKDDDLNLLQQNTIPLTLDFRTTSLKLHFADLLNDIMDQGANVFVNQLNTIENFRDKKEAVVFVTNQLINSREFSDKLHFFLKESLELLKLEDIKDVQAFLGKYFRHVFGSQMLNLWIPDGITGILYTVDPSGKEVRCLGTKGLLSDVIKQGKPYNKRHMMNSYICELTSTTGKYKVDNTLILPVKRNNGRIIGALEVSNIADSHFGFDEEYFGIVLGHLVAHALHKINYQNCLIQENKIKDLLIQSFIQLTACKTKYSLSKEIKECATKVFGISSANFMFVENEKFLVYHSEANCKEYEATIGLSGHVYKSQRGLIISDVSCSKEYNSLVDMVSIMPIYFAPVIVKNKNTDEAEIVGIFQLLIKPKGGRAEEKIENVDEMLAHIGLDEPTENLVNRYCSLIANSIEIFRERSQK